MNGWLMFDLFESVKHGARGIRVQGCVAASGPGQLTDCQSSSSLSEAY